MHKLERLMREKTCGGKALLPAISVAAASVTGELEYSRVAGPLSTLPGSRALKDDDVFWIASCTKLLTTICMLQCIENGLFTLDQDITTVLPEWKDPDILTGFDEETGEPILLKAKNKITIRHLLTHSAGIGGRHSIILDYQKWVNAPPRTAETTVEEWGLWPLVYEPGEGWEYSSGIDWAGKMIERVTKQPLSAYMSDHIFKPLSMTSTTFRQSQILDRLVPTTVRPDKNTEHSNGTFTKLVPGTPFWLDGVKDDFGGGGLYSVVSDYMKVLTSILRNDGMLLGRGSVEKMFKPHLTPKSHAALNHRFRNGAFNPSFYASITGNPLYFNDENSPNSPKAQAETDWGLGGLLLMRDIKGGRKKGTLSWSGLPNLYWWIDPTTGVCGMYATQLLPSSDPEAARMNSEFEKAVYEELELVRRFLRS